MNSQHLSALQRLEQCFEAIEAWNPLVNAMMIVDTDGARRAAQAADDAAAQ